MVCSATETQGGGSLLTCSRCKSSSYCCKEHQKEDWKVHKKWCYKVQTNSKPRWWEKERMCRCGTKHAWKTTCHIDGSPYDHYGVPELIIWPGHDGYCKTGWGNIDEKESATLKKRFEEEMGSNEEKLAKIRPQAFRWTCCGATLDHPYHCDHHGSGPTPCTCDFCSGGQATPQSIRKKTVGNYGLSLCYGPDPRSYKPGLGEFNLAMNETMMAFFGSR